jgi:hypothetical protein
MRNVIIKGDGVAAYCCLHLLRSAGVHAVIDRTDRARVPAIMLSDAALALIRDVFDRQDLFRQAHRIHKRVVAWGKDAKPTALPHSAVVVSEPFLLESLNDVLNAGDVTSSDRPDWTIFTSRPLPPSATEERFGGRIASAVSVTLKNAADSATCWIESTEDGWLFLIPNGEESAWLLSVSGASDLLLGQSRLISEKIASLTGSAKEFPACPRIMSPLCGSEWLACGTAAMAFDPICGDGTANAVREAILACAVARAADSGGNLADLLAHYETRLVAGFYRHLALCRQFYESGHPGAWWEAEVQALNRGLEWCARTAGVNRQFRYQLNGFELQAVS